jgi:cell division protein FtsL
MLARHYGGNTAEQWQAERERDIGVYAPRVRSQVKKVHSYKLFRRRLLVSLAVLLTVYTLAVVRSETLVRSGNNLINLKNKEAELIMKNNELRIQVEELKGPERITSIAEKKLGMSVARSNIYVKAAAKGN